MEHQISILVCTHNRAQHLSGLLESMGRMHVPFEVSYELIIVDNGSTDDTRKAVAEFSTRLPICYIYEARKGKSFALNSGLQRANGALVLFADDDVIVARDWLKEMWACSQRWPEIGCFQGRVLNKWECNVPVWLATSGKFQLRGPIANFDLGDREMPLQPVKFVGANVAVRRDVIKRTGLFRTDMGPGHVTAGLGEDTDYAIRMEDMKVRSVYVPGATVVHPVPQGRVRQEYFQKWAYASGRAQAKTYAVAYRQCAQMFGVPRYLIRRYLETRTLQYKYAILRNRPASFYYKVRSWELEGVLIEVRSWRRTSVGAHIIPR